MDNNTRCSRRGNTPLDGNNVTGLGDPLPSPPRGGRYTDCKERGGRVRACLISSRSPGKPVRAVEDGEAEMPQPESLLGQRVRTLLEDCARPNRCLAASTATCHPCSVGEPAEGSFPRGVGGWWGGGRPSRLPPFPPPTPPTTTRNSCVSPVLEWRRRVSPCVGRRATQVTLEALGQCARARAACCLVQCVSRTYRTRGVINPNQASTPPTINTPPNMWTRVRGRRQMLSAVGATPGVITLQNF